MKYAYLKIPHDGSSLVVWSGFDWKKFEQNTFYFKDFLTPWEESLRETDDGAVIRFGESHARRFDIDVYCASVLDDQLVSLARLLLATTGEQQAHVLVVTTSGLMFEFTQEDIRSTVEDGCLPEGIFSAKDAHIARLQIIIDEIKNLPGADRINVFGSASKGKQIPGDLDLFVDVVDLPKATVEKLTSGLMSVTRRFYPDVDPYVLVGDILHCRTDDGHSWRQSTKTKEMINAGRTGVPLTEVQLAIRPYANLRAPILESNPTFKI